MTDTPSKVPLPSSPPQVLPVADKPQREASSPSILATPPTFQANTGDRPASPTDSLDPTTSIFVRSPPPNQQSPFGRQVTNNGSFPVLIMIDTLLDGGPFTTWTTIIWDRAWGFPIFRSRLYNIVHDALEKFIDVDVDYPMMSKHFYQCKITDRAHVTKLDEITSTNYNAVFAMMGAMIGLHCLKFEVNHTIDERPGSPGLGMLYVPTEQRQDRGYAGAPPRKNRMSVIDQIKNIPRSVSGGILGPKKEKKRIGSGPSKDTEGSETIAGGRNQGLDDGSRPAEDRVEMS